jgi:hypothetical protein
MTTWSFSPSSSALPEGTRTSLPALRHTSKTGMPQVIVGRKNSTVRGIAGFTATSFSRHKVFLAGEKAIDTNALPLVTSILIKLGWGIAYTVRKGLKTYYRINYP